MDIDGFIATNQPVWDRLDALTRQASRRVERLSPEELDELVRLYQRVSTHLSYARTRFDDAGLSASLSGLVGRAGALVYGSRPRTWRAVGRFVTSTFPAALWRARSHVLLATLLFCLPAVAMGVWLSTSPAALEASAPDAVREAYVEEDFEAYYSADPSLQFASDVTTNNIQVGLLAFAGGIVVCLPTALLLVLNGGNLGAAAGLFGAVGELPRFWGLILPHGLLELTAVFVAGGAGLLLGWTLVDPGDRRRGEALVEEGRRALAILVGVAVMFVVSGIIEGFVTGSALPTWARVGIGVLAEAVFLVYAVVRGRAATAEGATGALGEDRDRGWTPSAPGRVTAVPSP